MVKRKSPYRLTITAFSAMTPKHLNKSLLPSATLRLVLFSMITFRGLSGRTVKTKLPALICFLAGMRYFSWNLISAPFTVL